jgi:beta-glucanase (GH16 family)
MISADLMPGQCYGYWEIRARINAIGKGQHLAFWLLPDDASWPPEFDILEVVGTNSTQFTANITTNGTPPPMTFYQKPVSRANGFYVFGFEWTPSTMRWTVDGSVVREHSNLIADKSLYMLISWEVGSAWPGSPDGTSPWPAEVEIDYVRVYAKAT